MTSIPPTPSVLSEMRTDTPGSGGPTVPAMRSPSSGFEVFIPVSDIPYRSRIAWPVRRLNSLNVSGNSGAEPEMKSRIERQSVAPNAGLASRRV